jgi:hypothetical protein
MAKNNLRVVYQNLVDLVTTSITASSTQSAATSTSNLKKDTKGLVWRSAAKTGGGYTATAFLLVDFGSTMSAATMNSIILPYTNLNSATASIKVFGYTTPPTFTGDQNTGTYSGGAAVAGFALTTTTSPATPSALCCPWNTLDLKNWYATTTGGANTYAYGGGTCARIWLPSSFNNYSARYLLLEITDNYTYSGTVSIGSTLNGTVSGAGTLFLTTFKPGDTIYINTTTPYNGTVATVDSNTQLTLTTNNSYTSSGSVSYAKINVYIEASRLIIGSYWSPKYNTDYGLSNTVKDLSTHDRTDAGDLITKRGPRYSSLTFDLKWLDQSDRIQLTKLLIGSGMSKPVFISLFPDNTDTGLAVDYEKERAHQCYGKMVQIPGVTYSTLDMYSAQIDIEEV